MGEVYLVRHPRLPRREALKILPPGVSADADYRQRFAREADIAASLWHPHIVGIHDRGEHDGQLWIAMDYVEGTDAAQLLRSRYPLGMPPRDVIEIIEAIADALDYAHESYMLHRDVKPANILIADQRSGARRTLLADFGIARAAHEDRGLTATNMAVGTVAYAAPEQLLGRTLDGRADQYALACTAYHLFTGEPPVGTTSSLGRTRGDLAAYDSALAKAMAKEPFDRFNTCRDFAAALRSGRDGAAGHYSSDEPTQVGHDVPRSPPTIPTPQPESRLPDIPHREKRSRTALMVATGLAALLAVGLVAFIGARLGQSGPSDTEASSTVPTLIPPEPEFPASRPSRTVTQSAPTVTVTQPGLPVPIPPARPVPATAPRPPGDLGLRTVMSSPYCNGQGIVVLGNVTTPGMYESGVQRLLDLNPGASYLRTDQSCPSLRQASDEGNPIYAVYRTAGSSTAQVCSAVRAAGGDAYGKWLDTTTDPADLMRC
ncbi:serine/threonine-protein kinase [Mycolicibacterium sediminis]|uniref:non-specific serine/threonine protein kinase n=2 Tax=Mycolicibacterium sediminis TaxID=1286180 RepID=A0A7I7QTG1_9MYCO|nr:serine/threonine protein kinase [Mycolicibacterium sediminis]